MNLKRVAGVVLILTGLGYALTSKTMTGAVIGSGSFNVMGIAGIFAFIGGLILLTVSSMKGLLIKTEKFSMAIEHQERDKVYKLMEYIGDKKYTRRDIWGNHVEVPGLGELTYKEESGNYILTDYKGPESIKI
jgi:hypothetical protein